MSSYQRFFKSHRFLLISLAIVIVTILLDEAIFSDGQRRVNPIEQISQSLQEQLDVLDEHIDQVSDVAIVDLNRVFSRFNPDEEMPYFIYENEEIIYWSTNRFVPKYGTLNGTYLYKFLDIKSGQYVVRRKVINSSQNRVVEIFALLPLSSEVPINHSFLEYGLNGEIFGRSSFVLSDERHETNNVSSQEGIFLFSFEGTERMKIDYPRFSALIFLLYIVAIFCFVFSGWQYGNDLVSRKKPLFGLLLLSAFVVFARYVMLNFQFPLSVIDWGIFLPDSFADSWLQPSIGDLFLNQVGLLIIMWFGYFTFKDEHLRPQGKPIRLLVSLVLLIASIAYFVVQVESLLVNSQWSFDVASDISFSPSKVLAYFSLFIMGIAPFLVGQFFSRELNGLERPKVVNYSLILILVSGIILRYTMDVWYATIASMVAGYLLVIFNFKLSEQIEQVNYSTFLYLFTGAFLLASISNNILSKHIQDEVFEDKLGLGTELQTTNDLTAEFLLSEARKNIAADVLIQTGITNPFSSKDQIRRTIRRVYLGDYFDQYDIEILLFNGNGKAMNRGDIASWSLLNDTYAIEANASSFEGLYLYQDDYPVQQSLYYLFIDIKRYSTVVGHVLIQLDRKQQLNNSILPQLLLEQSDESTDYDHLDYAIYEGSELISSYGDFNYGRDFDVSLLNDSMIYNNGVRLNSYDHLSVRTGTDQRFVISSPRYPNRYLITNFAVYFLFMVGAIILIFGITALIYNLRKTSTTLSTKIQILLNFAFFLPLIIVSIVVLRLVNRTVEKNIEQQYLSVTESAGENIANELQQFLEGQNPNNSQLEARIDEISQYARADMNLFNGDGRLIATNQRLIFENELLAPFINPSAMRFIVESGNKRQLNEERVGNLNYKSTFFGVRSNENGRLLGVLSMPFFDSEEQLKSEQREILSNILNSFTFIFVVFIVLSFLASRILTYPFKYLTEKIKGTTLSTLNEPIEWQADDEIGLMVGEYNKMLINLEKSKKALALSEKESAWREMAQQVAHEIKNPLTPMKLKLQHLKRVLGNAPEGSTEFNQPIDNLLSQVETLSDIATSFSSFAKMPIPQSERLDLVEELRKSIRLFNETTLEILTNIPRHPVWILGDKKLLGRIFNNLILNAEQAIPDDRKGKLSVELLTTHNKVRIIFTDNGSGIDTQVKDKVFIPKFSTKEEGSGIGLAIAKRGVEHAGGSIWFESTPNEGATFYMEFPLTD